MSELTINGISVKFPFQPYDLQIDYMTKVITCLENDQNGVLESPTGTGKTLSLLCSSLAWLEKKKAVMQAELQTRGAHMPDEEAKWLHEAGLLKTKSSNSRSAFVQWPQIIYSSRTHTQLSQAMKELKRTAYNHMRACALGSREQMCVHPQIRELEDNADKVQQCRIKVQTRSCFYHNHVQRETSNPVLAENPVVDIEDLVKFGDAFKFCPYYMARELRQNADIVFMPYNYLLDPRTRKALGVELSNAVVILDEAHNVEKICEESASMQIKSTDITLCIDEVTDVMKAISEENVEVFTDTPPDFSPDELVALKQIFLKFEIVLDGVVLPKNGEGLTNEGTYIFTLLENSGVTDKNHETISNLIDRICTYMATVNTGPFQRKGHGMQRFEDLLRIVFANVDDAFKAKLQKCYKVHIEVDESHMKKAAMKKGTWLSKTSASAQTECRVLSFWCFSPGFGMNMLMSQGVKSVILTSGTLAPLKPLITELEMQVDVRLENPHIVKSDQVCVKILSKGPDGTLLNSSYQNRNNPSYVKSLGMTISNLARAIPDGLLVFFPSYSVLLQCKTAWEEDGLWDAICKVKQIYVEPRTKDAFAEAMSNYYSTVNSSGSGGAIFMGVCRGKVSEGLDFVDANGRAVVITGLPYPPLKDPRVILKRRYLDVCNSRNKEYLNGNDWYSLEATKAVNQAIGRVIRHGKDYGSIILLDSRFNNPRVINQMSLWLRNHVKHVNTYGELIRELRGFYRDAAAKFPIDSTSPSISFPRAKIYQNQQLENAGSSSNEVQIHKRKAESMEASFKRQKFVLKANSEECSIPEKPTVDDIKEYLKLMQRNLPSTDYAKLIDAIKMYMQNFQVSGLVRTLKEILNKTPSLSHLFLGISNFLRDEDKSDYDSFLAAYQL